MRLSDIMRKWIDGEPLSPTEKQEALLQFRRLEESESLWASLIKPGTRLLRIDGLETNDATIANAVITDATITNAEFSDISVANAQVTINDTGVVFANQEGRVAFEDTLGDDETIEIFSNTDDELEFTNQVGEVGMRWRVDTALHNVMNMSMREDGAVAERLNLALVDDTVAGTGVIVALGNNMYVRSHGAAGGWAGLQMGDTSTPTDNPTQAQVYFKADKIVFRYLDGATIRYKYLDLTGVGVTWQHSTSAP